MSIVKKNGVTTIFLYLSRFVFAIGDCSKKKYCCSTDIDGEIIFEDKIRHTPSGLVVQRFKIEHQSLQTEANLDKQVGIEVDAIFINKQLRKEIQIGKKGLFTGFMDKKMSSVLAYSSQFYDSNSKKLFILIKILSKSNSDASTSAIEAPARSYTTCDARMEAPVSKK